MEGFGSKKLIRSKSGLRIVVANDQFRSPFEVQEPDWIPDKEILNCTKCQVKFGFTKRKHHCRRCGLIYCSSCCNARLELRRMCFIDPVRICVDCELQTKIENTFFDKHLKTLLNGANLILERYPNAQANQTALCKLSLDHRFILFNDIKISPVEISQITSLKVLKDSITGNQVVDIDYFMEGEVNSLTLGANHSELSKAKASNLWIKAIEEAYNLLYSTSTK